MLRRPVVWILVVLVLLALLATVSCTGPLTLRFTDEYGAPASDAYLRYYYRGSLINFVHPVDYVAGGGVLLRADADGRVTIPPRLHFRRPLPWSSPPHVFIDFVVVPRLHNTFGPIAELTTSRPGVFAIDEGGHNVTVFNVGRDPERWATSLDYLFDCVRATLARQGSRTPADPRDARTIARGKELLSLLRTEYAAFMTTYGQTNRPRPIAPAGGSPVERQQWQAQLDAELVREPTWGAFLERKWRINLRELEMIEEAVK